MVEITVYGKPNCQQCKLTTRHLEKLDLPYTYRDVTVDVGAEQIVKFLGYQSLPVVTVGDMHWNSYRNEKIKRLGELMGSDEYDALEQQAIEYLRNNL